MKAQMIVRKLLTPFQAPNFTEASTCDTLYSANKYTVKLASIPNDPPLSQTTHFLHASQNKDIALPASNLHV